MSGPVKYPGDAVFDAAPEFEQGAADYAAAQRLERAKQIAARANDRDHTIIHSALMSMAVEAVCVFGIFVIAIVLWGV